MNMNISEALKTSSKSFKAPVRFPAGHYEVVITDYDLVNFHWPKPNIWGLAYVPTFVCTRSIEATDEEDPEGAEEQQKALDDFGDWKNREFSEKRRPGPSFNEAWNGPPPNRVVYFGKTVFPLFETDDAGNFVGHLTDSQYRFHLPPDSEAGIYEGGFIHDVLKLSYPDGAPIEDLMEATRGKSFLVKIDYEPNRDPARPPNLIIADIASLP